MTRREYPSHPITGVAGVVFDKDDHILLVRRARDPGKGTWGIPGGMVELGERLHDALQRELLEETGLRVDPVGLITVVDGIQRDARGIVQYHYIIAEYLCRCEGGSPRPSDDVDRAEWVAGADLDLYDIPLFTREVIDKAHVMLKDKTSPDEPCRQS